MTDEAAVAPRVQAVEVDGGKPLGAPAAPVTERAPAAERRPRGRRARSGRIRGSRKPAAALVWTLRASRAAWISPAKTTSAPDRGSRGSPRPDRVAQVARPVGVLHVGATLRAREDDRRRGAEDPVDQIDALLHRVRPVWHDDTANVGPVRVLGHPAGSASASSSWTSKLGTLAKSSSSSGGASDQPRVSTNSSPERTGTSLPVPGSGRIVIVPPVETTTTVSLTVRRPAQLAGPLRVCPVRLTPGRPPRRRSRPRGPVPPRPARRGGRVA